MAALMTSMRLYKHILNLSTVVNNATKCTNCSKFHLTNSKSSIATRWFSSQTTAGVDEETESDKQKKEKDDANRKKYMRYLQVSAAVMGVCTCIGAVHSWGSPDIDAEGREVKDECSDYVFPVNYLKRSYKKMTHEVKVTREPSRQKLLPDPLTYPYIQPKYTLVIEMTDILVHPDWTYKTGWRFKKRPGIDVFLRAVGPPLFEVVIYTREQGMTADPIITKADPDNYIMYRLYRDATRYEDGVHIKDLRYLNRDLSKVIMIDWDKQALTFNQENGFFVQKWDGENNDTVLGELAEFLRAIAVSNVDDVRPVLQYYSQFDDPLSKFHENQIKVKEEQERQAQAMKSQSAKSLTSMTSFWKR